MFQVLNRSFHKRVAPSGDAMQRWRQPFERK
jgi:hypothetical protein